MIHILQENMHEVHIEFYAMNDNVNIDDITVVLECDRLKKHGYDEMNPFILFEHHYNAHYQAPSPSNINNGNNQNQYGLPPIPMIQSQANHNGLELPPLPSIINDDNQQRALLPLPLFSPFPILPFNDYLDAQSVITNDTMCYGPYHGGFTMSHIDLRYNPLQPQSTSTTTFE